MLLRSKRQYAFITRGHFRISSGAATSDRNEEVAAQLTGKVAIVTGGGRGIGRGITERFLAEGARVAILQRSEPDQIIAARENVLCLPFDMMDVAGFPAALATIADAFGGGAVLVNNAGIMAEHDLEDLTVEQWDSMMAVNTRAPVFLAQAALPYMRQRGGGSIINVGSVEGISTNPQHVAYAASKAAVHGMTRAMAVDLSKDGIRCNTIVPGWITSELSEQYFNDRAEADHARSELMGLHPVGRLERPEDIGDAAVFLAGNHASFMTGQMMVIDGGRTVKLPMP